MYIFIDESGTFTLPKQNVHSVSCVGALTIADVFHSAFESGFGALKQKWGCSASEVKGRMLGESQIIEFMSLLKQFDAIFHVCPTDLGCLSEPDVIAHQQLQAKQLLAHLTGNLKQTLVSDLYDISTLMAKLSPQLYIQYCLMNELVDRHIRDVVIYYAMTRPKELAAFRWNVDAKERKRVSYELIWESLLPASLQDRSLKGQPILQVKEGDYSHFKRFYRHEEKWPEHLPKPPHVESDKPMDVIDIKRIVGESFSLRASGD